MAIPFSTFLLFQRVTPVWRVFTFWTAFRGNLIIIIMNSVKINFHLNFLPTTTNLRTWKEHSKAQNAMNKWESEDENNYINIDYIVIL